MDPPARRMIERTICMCLGSRVAHRSVIRMSCATDRGKKAE
jgi:hypothetical protein